MTVFSMQTHFHPQSTGSVAANAENMSPSGDLVNESISGPNNNNNGISSSYSNDSSLPNASCSDFPCDASNAGSSVDDLVGSKDSIAVTSGAGDASVTTSRALPLMGSDSQQQSSNLNNITRDQGMLSSHQVQPNSQSGQGQGQQTPSSQSQSQMPTSLALGHSQQQQTSQSQQMHPATSQSQLLSQQQMQQYQHHPDHHQAMQQVRSHPDLMQGTPNLSQSTPLPPFGEIGTGTMASPSQFIGNPADMLCSLDIDAKGSFRPMSHMPNHQQQANQQSVHSQHNMQLPVNSFANVSQPSSLSPISAAAVNTQNALSYTTSLMKDMSLKDGNSGTTTGQATTSPGQYPLPGTTANGFFGRAGGDPLNSFFPSTGLGRSMDKPDAKLAATSVLWSNDINPGDMTTAGLAGVGFPSSNCTNNTNSFFGTGTDVGLQSQQQQQNPHSHGHQGPYAISSMYPGSNKRAITGGHSLMSGQHGGRSGNAAQFGGNGAMNGGGNNTARHFTGGGMHANSQRNYSGSNIWTLALQNQRMGNPPAPMNVIGAALNVQGASSNTPSTASSSGHGRSSNSGGSNFPNVFSKRHRPLPPHKQFELTNAVAATASNPPMIESSFSELSPAGGPHNSLSGLTTPEGGPVGAKSFDNLKNFGPPQHQTPQSQTAVENAQFYEELCRGAGFEGLSAAAFMSTNFMNATGGFEGDVTSGHMPSAAATLPGYLNPSLVPNAMSGGPPPAREERYSRKVFVGGLPPDIDEEEITNAFRRFGPLVVDWPHKAESKTFFPPKGYCFLLFQDEMSVQHLIEACVVEDQKFYWCVSSPTMKDKAVQIRPWNLADSDYVMDGSQPLDPRKTIFVGGVPRPLRALELAMIMDRLYGGVCYAGIDTDPELKYPKGAGRVAFSNQQSYIAAISARFVQLQHNDIDKRVEVKPYVLDDQMCDECQGSRCQGKFAPFFCANVMCLQYYCEQCWAHIHSRPGREFHKPLVKEGADRPRTMNFRW